MQFTKNKTNCFCKKKNQKRNPLHLKHIKHRNFKIIFNYHLDYFDYF